MTNAKTTNQTSVRMLIAALVTCALALALACIAQPMQASALTVDTQKMHRLYNPNSGEHFYTSSDNEFNELRTLGWEDEGWGWTALKGYGEPVYRLYNPVAGEHHYTLDGSEVAGLVEQGWNDEGIGWYSDPAINVPLYRLYNPNAYANNHHYTTSASERDQLIALGWEDEGEGWYGVETGDYYVDMAIKDKGTITISLNDAAAPETVRNFVELANKGFYNGTGFHRIIKGFMMQGGSPDGSGSGGSGHNITGEFAENNFDNPMVHTRGTLSMARATDPNSASSQFFIVHETSKSNSYSLDGKYAAFGQVISGIEIVDDICTNVPQGVNGAVATADRPIIEKVTVHQF